MWWRTSRGLWWRRQVADVAEAMSVRTKVAVELGTVAVLTTIFLVLFPRRNPLLDVALAGFALICIAASARYTKNAVWGAVSSPFAENRVRNCIKVTLWITIPVVILLFLIGGIVAYRNGGWSAAGGRILNWRILAAFGCYTQRHK